MSFETLAGLCTDGQKCCVVAEVVRSASLSSVDVSGPDKAEWVKAFQTGATEAKTRRVTDEEMFVGRE